MKETCATLIEICALLYSATYPAVHELTVSGQYSCIATDLALKYRRMGVVNAHSDDIVRRTQATKACAHVCAETRGLLTINGH